MMTPERLRARREERGLSKKKRESERAKLEELNATIYGPDWRELFANGDVEEMVRRRARIIPGSTTPRKLQTIRQPSKPITYPATLALLMATALCAVLVYLGWFS